MIAGMPPFWQPTRWRPRCGCGVSCRLTQPFCRRTWKFQTKLPSLYGHLYLYVCMYVCMYCMCLAVRRVRRQLTLGEAARVVRRALQVDATGPLTLVHTYIHLYVHEYFYTYNINLACSYTYIHTYSSGRAFPGPVWVGVSAADRASSLRPRDEQGQGEEERGA